MFTYQHYVPILKADQSEFDALRDLSPSDKQKMTPLLVLPKLNLKKGNSKDNAVEETIVNLVKKTDWIFEQPIFIDAQCVDEFDSEINGVHPVEYVFSELENHGVKAIPVISFSCSDAFKKQVAKVHERFGRGVCVLIEDKDYGLLSIQTMLVEIQQLLNCKRDEMDIILDYKIVNVSLQHAIYASAVFRISSLPNVKEWRTLTMAGVSFPQYNTDLQPGMNTIPRVEWQIWRQIIKTPLKRIPTFGDYDTVHPSHPDNDPRAEQHSRLRYTTDSEWLVLNEKSTEKLKPEDFAGICCELVKSPDYCGKEFSWGDNFIHQCANGTKDIENPGFWQKACTNHHLTFISRKISKLDLS